VVASSMKGKPSAYRPSTLRSPAMPMIDPAALKPLSAAILSDVMDSLVLVGRARTGLYMPAYEVKDGEANSTFKRPRPPRTAAVNLPTSRRRAAPARIGSGLADQRGRSTCAESPLRPSITSQRLTCASHR